MEYSGIGEYLENLVDRIDAPVLGTIIISFFYPLIHDTGQLAQFINRTPKLNAPDEAHVDFRILDFRLALLQALKKQPGIEYEVVAQDFSESSVPQVWTPSFSQAFSATVERLYINGRKACWQDFRIENNHWLEILRPFTSVKSIYLSRKIVRRIAPALQEIIGERVVEYLPALQTLFLEDLNISGPVREAIDSFVSGRQLSNHPVAISHWERKTSD